MSRRTLYIGLALIALSIFRVFYVQYGTPFWGFKVLPGGADYHAWIPVMGIGFSLTAYSLLSRRKLIWLGMLMVGFALVLLALFPPVPGRAILTSFKDYFLWLIFFMLLSGGASTIILYLLYNRARPLIKALPLIAIVPLMFAFMWYDSVSDYLSKANIYDVPARDEIYRSLGWEHCGDFYLEPKIGIPQRVTWRRELAPGESMACYFPIRVAGADRPYQVFIKQNITYELLYRTIRLNYSFYKTTYVITSIISKERVPPPFREFASTTKIIGLSEFSTITQRIDVLVSYKPGPNTDCPAVVSFDVEVILLWKA
jgi:hypothetical protein